MVFDEHFEAEIIEVHRLFDRLLYLDRRCLDLLVEHGDLRLNILHLLLVCHYRVQLALWRLLLNLSEYLQDPSVLVFKFSDLA